MIPIKINFNFKNIVAALTINVFIISLLISNCSFSKENKPYLLTQADFTLQNNSFAHFQEYTPQYKMYEPLGSGLAVLDINNDGNYEIFFSQFDKNNTASVLYNNNGDGTFKDITSAVGLSNLTSLIGVATGDFNNDGWVDLLAYGYKEIHLMKNDKGIFIKTKLPHFPENSFFTSAAFINANNDEYLDLWLSRYVELDSNSHINCNGGDGLPFYCAPSAYPFQKDFLVLNKNGESFSIETNLIKIDESPSLGVVSSDFNNDGLNDIYVANDGQNNFLFSQQKNGTFIEEAEAKNVAANFIGKTEASMGIGIGDYDNNGYVDVFLTHLALETNTLYKNEKTWFTDVTNRTKLSAHSRKSTGFGTGLYDLNGDNLLDIFIVNGKIQPKPFAPRKNLTQQFKQKPLLYLNKDNQFEFSNNKIENLTSIVGRGLVFVDIDNDGDTDMLSNNNNQKPSIFKNNLNPSKWLGLTIKCNNRFDIGAKLKFNISIKGKNQYIYRFVHTDGSYASSNDPRILFYLNEKVELQQIKITFTDSKTKTVDDTSLLVNKYTTIKCENS